MSSEEQVSRKAPYVLQGALMLTVAMIVLEMNIFSWAHPKFQALVNMGLMVAMFCGLYKGIITDFESYKETVIRAAAFVLWVVVMYYTIKLVI
jgi:hypothetical protein